MARWIAVSVFLGALVAPEVANAQSDEERAGARAAAAQGAQSFQDGNWAQAVDFFTRAEKLVHAPPHLLYLARAQVKLGHLVAAREAYMKVKREKLSPDAPAAFVSAVEDAKAELAALEPRMPYISIVVQGAQVDLPVDVHMDGVQVPPSLVGIPHPVDPGDHKFQAFAPDMKSNVSTVTIEEGAKETVLLTLQSAPGTMRDEVAAEEQAEAPAGSPPEEAADSSATPEDEGGMDGMFIGSLVGFGVGAIGIGAGTVFGLQALSKRSDANDICAGGGCPESRIGEVNQLDSDADTANLLSIISFGVGGAGIAAGTVLLILHLTDDGESSAKNEPHITPWVGYQSAGVSGAF